MADRLDPRLLDGGEAWREHWYACTWRTRRRIEGAVYRGEALPDAVEAALAVGLVRRLVIKQHSGPVRLGGTDLVDAQLRNAEENNLAVVSEHVKAEDR